MEASAFRASLTNTAPPAGISDALESLWWEAKGDWGKAHEAAQRDDGPHGCAVHAYLHRVEGDLSNAGYWYNRAKRTPAVDGLKDEWDRLAAELTA